MVQVSCLSSRLMAVQCSFWFQSQISWWTYRMKIYIKICGVEGGGVCVNVYFAGNISLKNILSRTELEEIFMILTTLFLPYSPFPSITEI